MNENWRDMFVGRDNDLKLLQEAWLKIQPTDPEAQPEAQLVVLLAESGLGKTRLVQEFYRWLSLNHDPATEESPEGYWPDSFLGEQASLDVNPQFLPTHQSKTPIPWLWWGMRFARIDGRNSTGSRCGLSDSQPALNLHLKPLLAARKLEVIQNEAIWTTASQIGNLVPGASLFFGIKDVLSKGKDWKKQKELRNEMDQSLAESSAEDQTKLENLAFDYFSAVLDTNNREVTTVPVVILLDDAQWADAVSLRFIERLLGKAKREHWPLMIVCTHWEREWHEQRAQPHSHADASRSLAEIVATFKLESEGYSPWIQIPVLHPIGDLSKVVTTALPGLTALQQDQLLAKADGNPLYLEEALDYFLDNTDFFVDENTAERLTADGIQALDELPSDLRQLVAKRFRQMEDAVKRALGWSSEQGQKFLTQITLACAQSVDDSISEDSIRNSLRRAQRPYSQIELLGDHGRFNRSEFRQAVFQEVANEYLHRRKTERENVQHVIRETLSQWLTSGEIDNLPSAERLDALLMARHNLSAASSEPEHIRRAWCWAMYRLAILYRDQFLWDQAWATAEEWAEAAPSGWALDWIAARQQNEIAMLLIEGCRFDLAHQMFEPILVEHERQAADEPNQFSLRDLSVSLGLVGEIATTHGRVEEAGQMYRRGLEISEKIVAQFGETPQSLRDLSVSLGRVGDIATTHGRVEEAGQM